MLRQRGFTLLEMLVALAVFAVIGVLSAQLLSQMINVTDRATERGARLIELQRAFEIMRRDFEQLTYRYVRDQLGDPGYDLSVGNLALIELTRKGWSNPTFRARSELQRVAYEHRDEALYRIYWPVLDRGPTTEPVEQLVLDGVTEAEFVAVDLVADEHSFWPLLGDEALAPERALVAIKVDLEVTNFGGISRLWSVPLLQPIDLDGDDDEDSGDEEQSEPAAAPRGANRRPGAQS